MEQKSANPNIDAFMVYKIPRVTDTPVINSKNQATTPLSDRTSCHENALIVKLVQNGARIARRNKGRHFLLTQNTIKYANGQATKLPIIVADIAKIILRYRA